METIINSGAASGPRFFGARCFSPPFALFAGAAVEFCEAKLLILSVRSQLSGIYGFFMTRDHT